ncbi:ABC-2 type transport system permease protein [Sulfobacillus thermosulfidooxidans DSM 9293]|uniref:ABC-2 type transport system permease protein n=1 Tax=Sulfobacillus thermosulfidooxidans (strain DSM 9293 / VKM B-1269 / AT-1) TaxID=929705 RepID=A0A1W1WID8_SULTA|nr:ABC transporter permease [Sulfobacillus thermosulfidooxidans]SMC05962.1 ABC-2 type transport system permease protein [Sulfobacillus thermosulfidooxidans DSM 9293]
MKPLLAQWKAEILRTVRDRRFFMLTLLMPIGFYLIFISEEKGTLAIAGTTWNAYFMVSMATFGVVGSSVNTLGVRLAAERKSGWVRWLRTTPLSPVAYALAKIFTQLTISLGIVVAIFLVAHFDQKVSLPLVRWLEIAAWLWIGSIPFAALGVLIGLAGNAAQVLGTLVYLSLSLLGGLWTPVQALPKSMQELARYMPTYRFAHPAWDMLSGRPLHLSDIGILILYTLFFVLTAAIIQKQLDVRTEA